MPSQPEPEPGGRSGVGAAPSQWSGHRNGGSHPNHSNPQHQRNKDHQRNSFQNRNYPQHRQYSNYQQFVPFHYQQYNTQFYQPVETFLHPQPQQQQQIASGAYPIISHVNGHYPSAIPIIPPTVNSLGSENGIQLISEVYPDIAAYKEQYEFEEQPLDSEATYESEEYYNVEEQIYFEEPLEIHSEQELSPISESSVSLFPTLIVNDDKLLGLSFGEFDRDQIATVISPDWIVNYQVGVSVQLPVGSSAINVSKVGIESAISVLVNAKPIGEKIQNQPIDNSHVNVLERVKDEGIKEVEDFSEEILPPKSNISEKEAEVIDSIKTSENSETHVATSIIDESPKIVSPNLPATFSWADKVKSGSNYTPPQIKQ
ncbi:hypothetical protein HK096_005665, partial [Nowakowskiella sp. JEL0078]